MKLLRVFLIAFGALGLFALALTFGELWLDKFYPLLGVTDPVLNANKGSGKVGLLMLALAVGAIAGNLIYRGLNLSVVRWDNIHSGEKVNVFIGVALGVIITVPFMVNFNQNGVAWATLIAAGMMILMSAIAIFALRSMEDVLPWSKNYGKARRSGIKILDTNVIIDGRIYDVVRCGFLDGQLYLPKFVLNELQYIADQGDPLKRQRGRRGLEVLKQLQSKFELDVGSQDRQAAEGSDGVDGRLVRLARAIGGDLVTNDNNLNRVADLQDVKVLNINDLALALRPTVLPGEPMELTILKEGSQFGQGVGYLDDGTMVVVEGGRKALGHTATVTVTQVHQTERGKMIFAELPDFIDEEPESRPRKNSRGDRS